MTSVDGYLADVARAMAGMDPRVRKDILEELRSHLADSAVANGGDVDRAIGAMGPAARVGREYRALYGYSRGYRILFAIVATVLAAFTLPVLGGTTSAAGIPFYLPNLLAFPLLILVVLWLLWISVQAGSRAGLGAGLGAFAARIVVAIVLVLGPSAGIVTFDGLAILATSSALLVLVGWLPGTAKQVWSKPSGTL